MVTIYGTGKSPWMPKGAIYHEGLEMAELLVGNGCASYEAPKEAVKEMKPTPEATPKNKTAAPAPKNKK